MKKNLLPSASLRYHAVLPFYFAFTFQTLSAQTIFMSTFGNSGANEIAYDGYPTADTGYIIAGAKSSLSSPNDGLLIKLDNDGDVLWATDYGNISHDVFNSVVPSNVNINPPGGCVAAGYITDPYTGDHDFLVVQVDASGVPVWAKTIGETGISDEVFKVIATGDGYLLAGSGGPFLYSYPIYLVKLDAQGNSSWSRSIGGNDIEGLNSIIQSTDGGYVIVGSEIADSKSHIILVKTDAEGKVDWAKRYTGTATGEVAKAIVETSDGGFALAGYSPNYGGAVEITLIKTDNEGNLLWGKYYGGPEADLGYDLEITYDGGFLIVGHSEHDGILVRTNATGDTVWTHTLQVSSVAKLYSATSTENHGYFLTGITAPYNLDFFFARTDSAGFPAHLIYNPWDTIPPFHPCPPGQYITNTGDISLAVTNLSYKDTTKVTSSEEQDILNQPYTVGILNLLCNGIVGLPERESLKNMIHVFPNPASQYARIVITAEETNEGSLHLSNMIGIEVYDQPFNLISGKNELELHIEQLPPGLYSAVWRSKKFRGMPFQTRLLIQ